MSEKSMQKTPEFADVTAEMVEKARATRSEVNHKSYERDAQFRMFSDQRKDDLDNDVINEHATDMTKAYMQFDAESEPDVKTRLAEMEKVERMYGEAQAINKALDTVASDGRSEIADNQPIEDYRHLKAIDHSGDNALPWRAYKINGDDTASRQEYEPGGWAGKDVTMHEFSPDHQERAQELVRSLIDKVADKRTKQDQQRRVKLAHNTIDRITRNANGSDLEK